MQPLPIRSAPFLAAGILVFGLATLKADGVIDIRINPASGTTLSASGSYRVVENVTMTGDVPAITLAAGADNVLLDLGGHTITAVGGSTTQGISGGARTNVTVINGTVRNFGLSAIALGARATIRDVRAEGNRSGGSGILWVQANAMIQNCILANNISTTSDVIGIQASTGSIISDNIIENNDASNGSSTGIFISGANTCVIANNIIRENNSNSAVGVNAIVAGTLAKVHGNVIALNSNSGSGQVRGINAQTGATLEGNRITGLSGTAAIWAIDAWQNAVIRNNHIHEIISSGGNAIGINTASGGLVEGNSCNLVTGTIATGINVQVGSTVRNNTLRGNTAIASGTTATGIISAGDGLIEGNIVTGHREGSGASGIGYGINAGSRSVIRNNQCSDNGSSGSDGSGVGIVVINDCLVEGNACSGNSASGTGFSTGIWVLGSRNRIVNNQSTNQLGGSGSSGNTGLYVEASDNLIAQNSTGGNTTRGITIAVAGNRTRQNESSDAAISGGSGLTGDLADIAY